MPTETSKPRLIDAEALLKEFCKKQKEFAPWDYDPIEIIDSAPTVETTDDVLARLPVCTELQKHWEDEYLSYCGQCSKIAKGKTPLEAVKNLEASINRK